MLHAGPFKNYMTHITEYNLLRNKEWYLLGPDTVWLENSKHYNYLPLNMA